jgi:hypothetical protein
LLYDIAACDRTSSLVHTIDSTRRLAAELGTSEDALDRGIKRVRARRGLLADTSLSTRAEPFARGSFTQRMLRTADSDWSYDFDEVLQRSPDPLPAARDATPLLLIGSTPADERLHETAERAGANILETLNAATPYPVARTTYANDPFEQIARRCRAHPWRSMLQAPAAFCDRALELRVAGVILWVLAEDTGLAWAYPRLARALRDRGIPVLGLAMQTWDVQDTTLDAIADFAGTVRTLT